MKQLIHKAIVPILFLLALSPLFFYKHAVQSLLLIITGLLVTIIAIYDKHTFTKKSIPFILCFTIITIIYFLFFSKKSFSVIGESFILFIVPLFIVHLYKLELFSKYKVKIMLTYCIAIGMLCLFFAGFYIYDIPHHNFNWYIARYNLEYNFKIHGTYICLWIAIAILFLTYLSFTYTIKTIYGKVLIALLFVLYASGLIIYNSRNIMIGLFIIGCINLFRYRKRIPVNLKYMFFLALAAILFLSQRYFDDIRFLLNNSLQNSTRYVINSCSLKLIYQSGFIGMDYRTIQDNLNACYALYDNNEFKTSELNSHNQYLDYFLKGGFLLFVSFIITLIIKLKYAVRHKNYLYFFITLLFIFSFVTENILIRQYGIYTYLLCDILTLGNVLGNESHTDDKIIKS